MNTNSRKSSIGIKMYLFIIITVLVSVLGTALISYFVSVDQIDRYYKSSTSNNARNFASMVDVGFFARLRPVAESDEFQKLRDAAEEADDEEPVISYLKEKGLWEEYESERTKL